MKKIIFAILLIATAVSADVKISQLPLGTAASTNSNDSFPYVSTTANATQRLKLSDLINLPQMVATYAPLASPTFTGTVTAPTIVLSTSATVGYCWEATSTGGAGAWQACSSFVNPMTTLGDLMYGGASGVATRLAGNTSTTKEFLTQTGTGSASAAPVWGTISAGDVPTLNQNTTGSAGSLTQSLTANEPVIGNGSGITVGTKSGNTTDFATANGALTSGDCLQADANGNIQTTGSACGSAGGGVTTVGTYNSQTSSSNGAVISGSDIYFQPFTSSNPGMVPASSGGTTNFLRADGTWAAPSGGGGTPGGANTDVQYNSSGSFAGDSGMTYDGAGNLTLTGKINATTVNASNATASTPAVFDSSKNLISGSYTGNTTKLATSTGSLTSGDCAEWDASGNIVDAGAACGTGSGGITALTGDVTASGSGSVAATLAATSNSTLTTLSGLTSASSLATVGTIGTGTWQGTRIGSAYGGTGIDTSSSTGIPAISSGTWSVSSLATTFVNLYETVATQVGDLIYGGTSGTPTVLHGNTSTQAEVLTSQGDGTNAAAPSWQPVSAIGISTDWHLDTSGFTISGLGTVSGLTFYSRRVGDTLEVQGYFEDGTVSASAAEINFPSNYVIDSTKEGTGVNTQQAGTDILARGSTSQNIYSLDNAYVLFYDGSTTNGLFFAVNTGATARQLSKALGTTLSPGSSNHAIHFEVPIVGWSSNTIGASQGAVYAEYYASSTITPAANAQLNFDSKNQDTGCLTGTCIVTTGASWKATAPVTGSYHISSTLLYAGTNAGVVYLYKNGSQYKRITDFNNAGSGGSIVISLDVALSAGDYVDIRGDASNSYTGGGSTPYTTYFSMSLNSGNGSGNVTSSGTGSYHVEMATVSVSSSSVTITTQSGSWLTSVSGGYSSTMGLNIAAGEYSSAPACSFVDSNGAGNGVYEILTGTQSSTLKQFTTQGTPSGTFTIDIICMGLH